MTIMKKTLLVAAAALITLSVSAASRPRASKVSVVNEKKEVLATPGAFKSFAAKQEAMNAFYSNMQHESSKLSFVKANRAEEEEKITLPPCYSEWTYYYSPLVGGFIPKIMHDNASFLVDGEKAYLAPFAELNYAVGTLDTEAENPYAEYGAVVYKFDSQVIGKYTDPDTKEVTNLVLESCNVENYTPVRKPEAESFYAYYISETKEFYIPSSTCLALFHEDRSKIELVDEYFVARALDLVPQDEYAEYMSKGTFTDKSYYGPDYDVTGSCEVYLGIEEDGSGVYYVKGADDANKSAWVEYEINEKDHTIATVSQNQFIGLFNFYDDNTHTTTHPGLVATVGLLQEDGKLVGFNSAEDYSSSYKITENADQTTTLANTAGTCYGDYIYAESNDNSGMYNCVDQSITILYEPVETGVKTVATEVNPSNAAIYNLAGQKVGKDYKGLVIKSGKKMFNK